MAVCTGWGEGWDCAGIFQKDIVIGAVLLIIALWFQFGKKKGQNGLQGT
jgi:hypothetical protein